MTPDLTRFRLLLLTLAGWISRHQQDVIDYLVEENRVLRELHGGKVPRHRRSGLPSPAEQLGWRLPLNRLS